MGRFPGDFPGCCLHAIHSINIPVREVIGGCLAGLIVSVSVNRSQTAIRGGGGGPGCAVGWVSYNGRESPQI